MTCVRAVRLGLAAGVLLGALAATGTGGGMPLVTWVVHRGADGTLGFAVRIGGVQWVAAVLLVLLLTAGVRPQR